MNRNNERRGDRLCHAGDGAALRALVVILDRLLRDDLELDRGRVSWRDGSLREGFVSAALGHGAAGGEGDEGTRKRTEEGKGRGKEQGKEQGDAPACQCRGPGA